MSDSKLTKNEFLGQLSGAFLAESPAWSKIDEHKRHYEVAVGRYYVDACLVFVSFGCRPDRYWFGQSVGWCPSVDHYLEWRSRRENPRDYPRESWLRHIKTLEKPKDFQNVEMRRSVSSLYAPYVSHSLEDEPPNKVLADMLGAVDQYAIPYLCLMLASRHSLEQSSEQLRGTAQE